MEHMAYAVQAVLPTLLLLLLGSFLRNRGAISAAFAAEGDHFCTRVLFPVLLFCSVRQGQASASVYMRSIGFVYGVIAVSIVAGLLIVPRLAKDRRQIAVLIQSLYRGNFTLYGIPFSQLLGGVEAASTASAIAAATLPVLNTAAVLMYACYAEREDRSLRRTFLGILKNPILWGVALGLLFRQAQWTLPAAVETVAGNLASMASPLAFLLLGTKLRFDRLPEKPGLTLAAAAFKLLAMPGMFLPIALFCLKLRGTELIPVLLFLAAPSAITTYQLAVEYEADSQLAGNIVMLSTLLSTVTLCVLVAILKSKGLI